MDKTTLDKQLEELQMIQCSLMPGETLTFMDDEAGDEWQQALDAHSISPDLPTTTPIYSLHFKISLGGSLCWLGVLATQKYDGTLQTAEHITLDLKGDTIHRAVQERWQRLFREKLEELEDADYPLYQLISTHILPPLHEELDSESKDNHTEEIPHEPATPPAIYHALLTSHHLISPSKRRSLQGWSSSLKISGFAKVGYPGVIYGHGERECIEEFVSNIKGMQWLALRVRFVEPLTAHSPGERTWTEFQKVGEVVEEMRRLGREEYVVEMGLGSAGEKVAH